MSRNDIVSRSPVSVFDISLIRLEGKHDEASDMPRLDLSPVALAKLADQSCATASTADDESDTLSTLSDCGEDSPPKRSIFTSYWRGSGESPIVFRKVTPPKQPEPKQSEDPSTSFPRRSPGSPGRRSVLSKGCLSYASAPSLPSCEGPSRPPVLSRKAHSSGELGRRGSILREARFSGAKRRSSVRSDSSSVTFDTKVDVRHFVPPLEIYSSGDWSKHFAT